MDQALIKKLMLDKLRRVLLIDKPDDLPELDGLIADTAPSGMYDLVFTFVFDLDQMEQTILCTAQRELVVDGGYLYLAYPKKGNKRYKQYIDRDAITAKYDLLEGDGFVAGTNLKFSKMVALNDVFTLVGLRRFDKHIAPAGPSQCVADYVDKIPALREALAHRPEIVALYDALTPGYQKDWARYVYSAQTDATREKRLLETADLLAAGYKSKALYRQAKP